MNFVLDKSVYDLIFAISNSICSSNIILLNYSFSDEELFEATISVHFLQDIASTDELSLDINLWNSWPIGISLNLLTELFVIKNVNIFELFDTVELEDLYHIVGEATPWHLTSTLHE